MANKQIKIALLVDVDNVKISKTAMEELLESLNQKGEVVYCKFYGYNDRKHLYLTDYINNYGYETAPFMRLKKRFSQLDNRIIVDAIKLNYTKPEINTYCIVAGDGDLIPLLVELKSSGKVCIDVNTEYQQLNTHMFDEHLYLRNINVTGDAYTSKTKKVAKPAPKKPAPAPAPVRRPEPAPVKRPAPAPVYDYDDEEEEDEYVAPSRPAPAPAPKKPAPVAEYDYDDDYESDLGDDLSEILKDITNRYNRLDFTNDSHMSEKLRLIRDIENLIERENSKGEGIYSANEDIRQIFNDLQDVVDDMKNAL